MPPKVGWSREDIGALKPRAKGYEVRDPGCRGLWLRILPSGEKSWAFRYSVLGRSCRVSLGLWPGVTVEQAERQADAHRIAVRDGRDPRAEQKARAALDLTVAQLAERFEAEHVPELKASTQKQYRYYLKKWIKPRLGAMLVRLVGLAHLQDFKRSFGARHRTANLNLAVISVLLSWAEEQGLRPPGSNPAPAVKRHPVRVRHRFLDPGEVGKLLEALDAWTGPPYPAAAIRLLLLTGARRSEIRRLRWKEVDEAGTAELADHKTQARGERRLFLPAEAVAILQALPQDRLSEFVFAGKGKDGTIGSSLDHAWRALRHTAGLDDVPLHALRHTWASLGLAEGLTLSQVGANLGHSSPATTQKYSHLVVAAGLKNAEKVAAVIKKKAPEGA